MSTDVSPSSTSDEDRKAARRDEMTRIWCERLREWDWFPVSDRLKNGGASDYKLGSRRVLMEVNLDADWLRNSSGPERWLEEYCFEAALELVTKEQGLALVVNENHGFWVSLSDPS